MIGVEAAMPDITTADGFGLRISVCNASCYDDITRYIRSFPRPFRRMLKQTVSCEINLRETLPLSDRLQRRFSSGFSSGFLSAGF